MDLQFELFDIHMNEIFFVMIAMLLNGKKKYFSNFDFFFHRSMPFFIMSAPKFYL
jgi:hypothetical protein